MRATRRIRCDRPTPGRIGGHRRITDLISWYLVYGTPRTPVGSCMDSTATAPSRRAVRGRSSLDGASRASSIPGAVGRRRAASAHYRLGSTAGSLRDWKRERRPAETARSLGTAGAARRRSDSDADCHARTSSKDAPRSRCPERNLALGQSSRRSRSLGDCRRPPGRDGGRSRRSLDRRRDPSGLVRGAAVRRRPIGPVRPFSRLLTRAAASERLGLINDIARYRNQISAVVLRLGGRSP